MLFSRKTLTQVVASLLFSTTAVQGMIPARRATSLYDGGTLEDYLKTVKTWLDANPNEVLSMLIVNIDNAPASTFGSVYSAAGVDVVSYAPPTSPIQASSWPTLGSMIDSGKRLVTFMDNQADLTAVPYIIDEFTNVWETAFDVIDAGLFDCTVNRTKGDTTTQMYLINHFLDKTVLGQAAPDVDKANVTNAASGAGSLGEQVKNCTSVNSRPPNFLLVDQAAHSSKFYEYGGGSVFQVAATINGVTYAPTTPIAAPLPKTSTDPSSASSTGTTQDNGALSPFSRMFIIEFMLLAMGVTFGAYAAI
ncbi:hypothetical protein C0992_010536 [Termitomyces sp. T32_za158]|nr:hypothetical protein C0992_010536 [Termitomyces sp. T32_za158]